MSGLLPAVPQPRLALAMLVYVALFTAWIVFQPFGRGTFEAVENLAGVLPPALAGLLAWRASATVATTRQQAWQLIAAGCFCWTAGDLIWTFYAIVLERDTPFPSLADAAYLLAYPLLFAGIQRLASPRHRAVRVRSSLDAAAMVAAVGTVLSAVLLKPIFDNSNAPILEKLLSAAYPLFDLALFYAVLIAIPRARDTRASAILALFSAGTFVIFVTDVLFSYKSLDASYTGYSLIDAGWVVGFGLLAYATSLQKLWAPSYGRAGSLSPSWRPLVTLGLMPLMVVFMFLEQSVSGGSLTVALFGLVFTALVVARQSINFLDAVTLNKRLKGAYESVSQARAELDRRNSDLVRNLADEHERATIDGLTGVLNRTAVLAELDGLLKQNTPGGVGCAVGIIDIDALKTINDKLGHLAGDEHIRSVTAALQVESAIVGRVGGDEFLVVLPDTDLFSVRLYRREVRSRLEMASRTAGHSLGISVSMGFSLCPEDSSSREDLLRMADARMYVEKVSSRGRTQSERVSA